MRAQDALDQYRRVMAKLLSGLLVVAGEMELWLDVPIGARDGWHKRVLEEDETGGLRIMCALLLRKARLHLAAVLQANETCNVHSLGVQMRPVLECAGQIVFYFHKLKIEADADVDKVVGHMVWDAIDMVRRATKADVDRETLLKWIAPMPELPDVPEPRVKRKKFEDKVALLPGGRDWYRLLSQRFCHGEGAEQGDAWYGEDPETNRFRDVVLCVGTLDYLAEITAVMIAYAALCPMHEGVEEWRMEAALKQLQQVRAKSKQFREPALSRIGFPDADGGSR